MKKILFAASAALAVAAMAPAANASVSLSCPSVSGSSLCTFDGTTGIFGSSLSSATSFTDQFFITTDSLGDLSFTLTNTAALSGISFDSIQLFDNVGNFIDDIVAGAVPTTFSLAAGTYELVLTGSTTGRATYTGTIDFAEAAVPEPATWAMMVAGIAAVGMTMRRRSKNVRVAFS